MAKIIIWEKSVSLKTGFWVLNLKNLNDLGNKIYDLNKRL